MEFAGLGLAILGGGTSQGGTKAVQPPTSTLLPAARSPSVGRQCHFCFCVFLFSFTGLQSCFMRLVAFEPRLSCRRCGRQSFLHPLAAWFGLLYIYIGPFRSPCVDVPILRPVVPEVWLTSYSPTSSAMVVLLPWLHGSGMVYDMFWLFLPVLACVSAGRSDVPSLASAWLCAVSPSSGHALMRCWPVLACFCCVLGMSFGRFSFTSGCAIGCLAAFLRCLRCGLGPYMSYPSSVRALFAAISLSCCGVPPLFSARPLAASFFSHSFFGPRLCALLANPRVPRLWP